MEKDAPFAIAKLIGHRYRIGRPLGHGGMGQVYEATDEELGRTVALKVLPAERWDDPLSVERFLRQARAMARIEHPGTVRVYDRGLHEDRMPYVVMERLHGRDLREILRERARLSPEESITLGVAICEVVHAVHLHDVLHRDLKPSNVFLVEGEGSMRIRLLDFGLARLAGDTPLTGTNDVLGTLHYMAPELLDSAQEASVATEVYAVACLVYRMLTGHLPFRAHGRGELMIAIRKDAPVPLIEYGLELPPGLQSILFRALEKSPADRHPSMQALAEALRTAAPRLERTHSERPASWFPVAPLLGGGRFRLLGALGEGSTGTVYSAIDEVEQRTVALKRLRFMHGDDLFRLKREFRTAAEIRHVNLVRLHELHVEAEQAFFTMDIVQGEPLLSYLRRLPEHLPRVFREIAEGLNALHARGLVHRDLKPANVVVCNDGHAVLLDFGLTIKVADASVVAGTAAYMAPEVLEGVIGPEADLFALGVMLHEALYGRRPTARTFEESATSDSAIGKLCVSLLAPDRKARPNAGDVVACLRALASEAVDARAPSEWDSATHHAPFVGRQHELDRMRSAFARTSSGAPAAVLVRGQSGIGKSTLLAKLAREAALSGWCLSSRCRQSEVIPFPAIDAAIDMLSEHLRQLPAPVVAPLMPRHVRALAQIFPVLLRIDAVCAREPDALPRDPSQVRALAYAALRDLLRRLAEQQPIVLLVDDLQWIDADSASLLSFVLAGPDPPALMFVGALRDDGADNPALKTLMGSLEDVQLIELAELDSSDCHALVYAHDPERATLSEHAACQLVEQSGGVPFFLSALVAHALASRSTELISLDALLQARFGSSSGKSMRLLELSATCERPLPLSLLLSICRSCSTEDVRELIAARLLRSVRLDVRGGTQGVEPYHARIREAVLRQMDATTRRERHRALARALAAHEVEYPEALIVHLAGCGEGTEAALLARRAALAAEETLSFDRAAALYEVAIRCDELPDDTRLSLLIALATALRNAGRSVDAAATLERASAQAPPGESDRLLREAGELLLFAGRVEEGLRLLHPMLARAELVLPQSVEAAIAEGLEQLDQLSRRGLARTRRAAPASAAELERFELCLSLANGLAMIDLRGVPFAVRVLVLGLELDDPERLQRASAAFAMLTATLFFNPLIEPALALCRQLTAQTNTPYARALLHLAEGEAAHFSGRFLVAEAAYELAERTLLESCVGKNRELAAARAGTVLIEYAQKGDFRSQLERTLGWQADAATRRNAFHENMLRLAHSIVWIAHDRPDKARAELERARQEWKNGAGAYELGLLEFWDIIDRYLGDDDAHLHPLQGRQDMLEGPAATSPFLAGYIHLHRAWGSIRALAHGRHTRGERALARSSIDAMRSLGPDIWQAMAFAFEANLTYLGGERERALQLLDDAERIFRRLHMRCLAACARLRHGELAQGDFGARLAREGTIELTQLGVARPPKWSRAYFSLFEVEHLGELTLASEDGR